MENTINYEQQAIDFINKVNAIVSIKYLNTDYYFYNDKDVRNVYMITIKRNGLKYAFKFGDSVYNTKNGLKPTVYGILSCLQKHDVGNFNNFCDEFDYDSDSRQAEKTYKAVCREYKGILKVFGDVMDELNEIQ